MDKKPCIKIKSMKTDIKQITDFKKLLRKPKKFKTVGAMSEAIVKYFDTCQINKAPMTIQGLTIALGFSSRQSLLNYKGYTDAAGQPYKDLIDRAKLIIEEDKVRGALMGTYNNTFAIFDLVNNHKHENRLRQDNNTNLSVPESISFVFDIPENMKQLPSNENDIIDYEYE